MIYGFHDHMLSQQLRIILQHDTIFNMTASGTEKYSLLRSGDDDRNSDVDDISTSIDAGEATEYPTQRRSKSRCNSNLVLLASITTNLVMGVVIALILSRQNDSLESTVTNTVQHEEINKSPYAKLSVEPDFRFPYSNGYGPEVTNHTLADIRWESIDINPGIVAIDQEWAVEHNLVPTQPFPWEPSKGVYTINAYHTLHCLKNLHRMIYDAHHGRPLSRDVGHAMHCIDHMRKDAMCNADDFLLPTPPENYGVMGPGGPRGQSRVCKNWDKLVEWADQHNACYQHITDDEAGFAKDRKEIERYANCPADSPYRVRMERYFSEHGMDLDDIVKKSKA